MNRIKNSTESVLWVLLAFLVVLPLIFLNDLPLRDVVSRYIPMADAFKAGAWDTAFHPRIPFLVPFFGSVCARIFGCGSFLGLKIISALFFALSTIPLRAIFLRLFDRNVARGAMFCLLCCYPLLRIASSGLRESTKMFFFFFAVYGLLRIFEHRKDLSAYLLTAAASSCMVLTRDDSLLPAFVLFLTVIFFEIYGTKQFPWRSFLALLTGMLILLPQLYVNYQMTGYVVPSARFAVYASRAVAPDMFGTPSGALPRVSPDSGEIPRGNLFHPKPVVFIPVSPSVSENNLESTCSVSFRDIIEYLKSLAKGVFYWFALPAFFMIVRRKYTHFWTSGETLLFFVWAGYFVLTAGQVPLADGIFYCSDRYLILGAPLLFGWTFLAFSACADLAVWNKPRFHLKNVGWVFLAGIFLLSFHFAMKPLMKNRFQVRFAVERSATYKFAGIIRSGYDGPSEQTERKYELFSYHSFRRPLVVCRALPALGILSGGESVLLTPREALEQGLSADYLAEQQPEKQEALQIPTGYEDAGTFKLGKIFYILWKKIDGVKQ